jgi:DNA repair exonuclease SbcCD nuclease subunit
MIVHMHDICHTRNTTKIPFIAIHGNHDDPLIT